jgi:microcin C transport system permease protein
LPSYVLPYALKRILLVFPTLLGILVLNFLIINTAPGGPVDQMLHRLQKAESGEAGGVSERTPSSSRVSEENLTKALEKQFGLDKPLITRFFLMVQKYLCFDFGKSYFSNESVLNLIWKRLPVSLSLGLWSTLLIYLISIPLGIRKAVRNGSLFDAMSSFLIVIGYAIPGFLFALLLIIFFAGGSFYAYFPLRGLHSTHWADMGMWERITDYAWHMTLPLITQVVSGFAALTLLTKNAFLEEMSKQYVLASQAQGFKSRTILFKHIFRNAMLIVVAGLPLTLMHIFFTGSFLIEMIFSLDGLGLLGYEAILNRDYPVIFGSLYIFTLMGLLLHLLSDLLYTWIDPRIHFQKGGLSL